jgi:hypothetical protein
MSAELLEKLRNSAVFRQPLPARIVYSNAEWAALGEEARREPTRVGVDAIRLIPGHAQIEKLVRQLGSYEPATNDLIQLWQRCPVSPIRHAAGHALRELGTPPARAALIASVDDATDFLSRNLGVRALFEEGPSSSHQRLLPYFDETRVRAPGGATVPNAILSFFCPSAFRGNQPMWNEPRAPSWLSDAWLSLCVRLRQHELLGDAARDVLRHADAAAVERALAASPLPPQPAPRVGAQGDLLARYQRGEHSEVWKQLRGYGAIDGDLRHEALAVARATMERVRQNVALLASRLAERGWRALSGSLHTPPDPEDVAMMAEVEKRTGAPLPHSLRAFWEIVGGVDFVWDYQSEEAPADLGVDVVEADPLCVNPARVVDYLFEEWEDRIEGVRPELRDPYNLDLAPDYLHKADISGGPPYGVELPFLGADPIWVNEEHQLPFVDYLRLCFQWAGFPRLERDARAQTFVREFGAGLIAF